MIVEKTQTVRTEAAAPEMAGDVAPSVLQIALQLRTARTAPDAPLEVLLVPATGGHSIDSFAEDLGAAFRQLGEGPVMVASFPDPARAAASRSLPGGHISLALSERAVPALPDWRTVSNQVGSGSLVHAQMTDASGSELPLTERVNLFLNQARRVFRTVVIRGHAPVKGAESVIAASSCRSTVLAVAAGVTTRTELRETRVLLERCGARVQGLIYDSTPAVAQSRRARKS